MMNKKILGLDLGTSSIGWALVNEKENNPSEIIRTGARIVPLTTDESKDFEKGKSITINADRTLKRGMRRNLQRYKLRRNKLIEILKNNNLISKDTILTEKGKDTTHQTLKLRAKAAIEKIELEEFARVLLSINKKRGYKSNRKAKDEGDGTTIDGMEVAKKLYHDNLTPGQYSYQLLLQNKKHLPEFYRSDLQNELDKIWDFQKKFYPKQLTDKLKEDIKGKNIRQTYAICEEPFKLVGVKRQGNKKIENYKWRFKGLEEQLDLEQLIVVLQEINGKISNSSGLLGEISDRSKELYFSKQTVGQYLYNQIKRNKHTRLKQQVFYRQDYLDEFEQIWKTQAPSYSQLTNELKTEVRDIVIFYQRRLKSQKGLISICELEGKIKEIEKDGKTVKKLVGPRCIPKSSPLFQEYKIWQILNNLVFKDIEGKAKIAIQDIDLDLEKRNELFEELNVKGKLTANDILKIVFKNSKAWKLNFKNGVEGNNTNQTLYKAYQAILELSGHEKITTKKDIAEIFNTVGINSEILHFDSELEGKAFEQQASYQLWHLLYSYEEDDSKTGNETLIKHLKDKFGFDEEYAKILANISLQADYGNLSTKAIKKILPYLKAGHEYSEACNFAGYNHSHSVTREENKKRELKDSLELLPKNSLRNPVVEKILNQMVNVVNAIIIQYGKPDEIRIELARELKKSAKERAEMTKGIADATKKNEDIIKELEKMYPFNTGVRITKNDITKYKLYQELESNGSKTIYTNTYIQKEEIFSKKFDIEHIIPKSVLFDDSFSNKTLSTRDFNLWKGNRTGLDAMIEKYGENSNEVERYKTSIEKLYKAKKISKAKYNKLLMTAQDIPDGFIERDLRNTQYISKKSVDMLKEVAREVTTVTGSITDKLREDWQLVDVMKELNWDKYDKLGLTQFQKNKNGEQIPVIKDWTKRNDHRHHAMDALAIAFTKHSHIQYFNYLNARKDETHKKHKIIKSIEDKETILNDKNKRLVKPPIPIDDFRAEVKKHLDNTLISFKTKNKVVTTNINRYKTKKGYNTQKTLTPRGQLHNETVYGMSQYYKTKETKLGTGFDEETINLIGKKSHREAVLKRLKEFDNDPKKAFGGKNSPAKNPIYLDEYPSEKLPEKVKLVEKQTQFTIRKEVSPELNVKKVIDRKVRTILEKRLQKYNNEPKKAFVNLEKDPIWLNKEKGIQIKRVTISGARNAEPLHYKKDLIGELMLDKNNKKIPVDYVQTSNNHHIAIYKDEKGNLQEEAVSFYEAVIRKNQKMPIINRNHPEHPEWEFLFTLKQNEMFVFPNKETGFEPSEIDLLNEENYYKISPNLFRVRKISKGTYNFIHHLETSVTRQKKIDDQIKNIDIEKIPELRTFSWRRIQTTQYMDKVVKIRINHLGRIVKIGE